MVTLTMMRHILLGRFPAIRHHTFRCYLALFTHPTFIYPPHTTMIFVRQYNLLTYLTHTTMIFLTKDPCFIFTCFIPEPCCLTSTIFPTKNSCFISPQAALSPSPAVEQAQFWVVLSGYEPGIYQA